MPAEFAADDLVKVVKPTMAHRSLQGLVGRVRETRINRATRETEYLCLVYGGKAWLTKGEIEGSKQEGGER